MALYYHNLSFEGWLKASVLYISLMHITRGLTKFNYELKSYNFQLRQDELRES